MLRQMKKGTYLYTVLLAIDRFGAAILFNRADITISSLCWIYLNRTIDPITIRSYRTLNLYGWQAGFLGATGTALERISPGHCARARISDIETGQSAMGLLQ